MTFSDETPDAVSTSHLQVPPRKRNTNPRRIKVEMAKAMELLRSISREFDIDMKSMRDPAVYHHFVKARKAFCERGRSLQISVTVLGWALHRDSTTVSYHSNARLRERKRETRTTNKERNNAR